MARVKWCRQAAAAICVAAVVVLGIWLTGAVLTQDATAAMVLTAAFLAAVAVVVAAVSWRQRTLAWPLLITYMVVAGGLSTWLLVTSTRDVVVSQPLTTAAPSPNTDHSSLVTGDAGPVAVASGTFVSAAHPTTGKATLVERSDGSRVLALAALDTDPGPDLRVYLVPGDGTDVEGGVDLGALKGNRGDQEYEVPNGAPEGAVVIWCRAFSVGFGHAPLS